MEILSGKRALVTGASSGFGEATALKLAGHGVKVLAIARRRERLERLKQRCPDLEILEQDITADLGPLREALEKHPVDILVNNAGLAKSRDPIQDHKKEDWGAMIDTNLKGLINVTQLVLPHMIKCQRGDIVNIGSIAAFQPYPGGSVYNASKFAVRALTEAWQMDLLGQGIRVMGVHPGMAETEFSLVRFDGDETKAKKVYQGTRALTAEDIADTVLWVLSRPAHVNIQSLVVLPTDQASLYHVFRRT